MKGQVLESARGPRILQARRQALPGRGSLLRPRDHLKEKGYPKEYTHLEETEYRANHLPTGYHLLTYLNKLPLILAPQRCSRTG